ncbi:hypothetical protein [Desulfosarcina ovata]|uniref:hypothetical protein n=1 Tax=Desulfosarcina ovata TaxID=83564 RepID=UPI0012D326E8|nr:hypothetical protein [Desulfosarcina ovata]
MKKGSPQCCGTAESALALPQGGNENPDLISSKDGPFLKNCKFLPGRASLIPGRTGCLDDGVSCIIM